MSDYTCVKMITKCDVLQGNEYVSCIKINGNPILPPLVTPEKRLELENYKKRAVDIERRLKCQKDLKTFIDTLDSCNLQIGERVVSNKDLYFSRTLEHVLSFGGNCSSYNDALNVSDISKKVNQSELPSDDNKEINVPLKKKNQKSLNLTCNTFDVTQYSNDGIVVFSNYVKQTDSVDKLVASTVELDLSDSCCVNDDSEKRSDNELATPSVSESTISLNIEVCQPKPRLRSNSYTLDSPSPILLEHLKKQAKQDLNNSFTFDKQVEPLKRRSLDLGSSINKSLDDLRCKTFISHSNRGMIDHSISLSSGIVADISGLRNECDDDDDNTLNGCDLTSVQKVVENLAEKHFGTIRESKKTEVLDVQCNNELVGLDMARDSVDLSCLNSSNLELQDLPENCIKDIMEFLERYKNEQDLKLKSLREDLNKNKKIQEEQVNTINNINNNNDSSDEGVKLLCCENVIDTSPEETLNPLNASTPLLIDFESDSCVNEPLTGYDSNCSFTNSESLHTLSHDYQNSQRSLVSSNCSKELFPKDPKKLEKKLKQQWAATILTAAAKGFLVRRLKRTERVKNLMQTIQEALLCAMSLHTENSENIRQSDVELHRRLIQQVSAACYEFYDIFFHLTTKEQMAVIALDRQRLQEKMRRPKSVSSTKSNSSRSSVKSKQISLNSKQRKSLTPSFAA